MKHKATKRILSLLLAMVMLIGLLPTAAIPVFAVEESDIYGYDPNYEHGYFLGGAGAYEGGTWVREVYDWSDLYLVFQDLDRTAMIMYDHVTVKLMNDLSMSQVSEDSVPTSMVTCSVSGWSLSNIVFDFNGHTLNGTRSSTTDYSGGAFIELRLISGNCFTFIDSVGGGGINFSSEADHDNDVAALYINTSGERGEGYNWDDPDSYPAKVTFNGGSYKLNNSIERYSRGTLLCRSITYRGTVIANYVDVEINDGTFIAESECKDSDDDTQDLSARELSAFGTVLTNPSGLPEETNPEYGVVIPFEETGRTVINGGRFISDGYAVHHFDNCYEYLSNNVTDLWANNTGDLYHNEAYVLLDSHYHMNYPTINGGYFEGQLGFTGLTYTYSEGNPDLCIRPTSQIIPETSRYFGFDKDGNITFDTLNWKKLHDLQKCIVISEEALGLEVTPEGDGNPVKLIRNAKQSDTFEMSWTVPSYLEGVAVCQPMITVTRPNSNIEPKTYSKSKLTLDYSDYPNDVNISCRLYVVAGGVGGESVYFEQNYEVDVNRIYTATDGCIHCYAAGEDGWDEVVEGGSCSFKIYPKDYYELTDPDKLEVYVNGDLVTPDGDGVYTVENVTEDLDIYCDGTGFTSYSNLTVTANGKTVTEKIFDGGTYTFKTLAEFGATVPENSTFTGWKIGNKTYQPGETFTVTGTGEIAVNAAFTGLHTITVENGKAYADEAHTIPISAAAEDQVIYIVADPAPEGKVFSYWSHQIATAGGGGSFGNYDAAQTTYKVYYSDVVLTPVYETQIDNIVINGMVKPSAGVAIDNSDYSYKWGCSVPADAGYSLGICYWYDITDGEPEFAMSNGDVFQIGHTYRFKAKINLYGDTILAAKEDISVALTGLDADSYTWTISEYSQIYENMVIYFEFTCEREEPDTALICPKGDGTSGNPFQITNIGELYWFAAFVNGTASYPDGVTVERSEACAIVMNDITVNPGVLTEDGELNGTSGFAQWTPIGYDSNYSGTFDGQEHTISGIYYAPQAAADYRYGGFFRSLFKGGCIRNLTLADSYFRAPAKNSAYTGAFVGYIASSCTVENCHFDGTVTTAITADSSDADKETYQYVYIAGIAGDVTYGEIRDCTTRGLISGYGSAIGGIASYVNNGEVSGCVNEATVETPNSWGDIGGIAGRLYKGIIRDCRNKGNVIGRSSAGIVSNVEDKTSAVIRCWNEGKIEGSYGSGIVLALNGSIKNCYNTGSVDEAGIVGTAYSGSSVTYCHNVGEITGYLGEPICSISSGSNITIENCYYLADSETDSVDGTTYKTADQFADGTVQALLDNGHWTQGDGYPILAEIVDVSVTVIGSINYTVLDRKVIVDHDIACKVGYISGGNYVALSATANGDGTYSFTVPAGVTEVLLVVKGDANQDGRLTAADIARVNAYGLGKRAMTASEIFSADVDGDGNLNNTEIEAYKKAVLKTDPIDWSNRKINKRLSHFD